MTKKNVMPEISEEEFNSMIGMDYLRTGTGKNTEASILTDYGEKKATPESTLQINDGEEKMMAEPTVERIREIANAVNAARAVTDEPTDEPTAPVAPQVPSTSTAPAVPELPSAIIVPGPLRRPSSKQRKASFEEYRETFLRAPKIADRQPVFLSREVRDRLDEIVRRLGDRKMSVSGLLENIARQHIEAYAEDIEVWKRL